MAVKQAEHGFFLANIPAWWMVQTGWFRPAETRIFANLQRYELTGDSLIKGC